jgi:hypothetical protein
VLRLYVKRFGIERIRTDKRGIRDRKSPETVPFKMRIAPIKVKASDKTISISRIILIAGT